jgi:hypothetical protein
VLIIRPAATGLTVIVVGCTLLYVGEPWLDHLPPIILQPTEGAHRVIGMCVLFFTFGLAGYCSARVAKQRELRWGAFWSLVVLMVVVGIMSYGSGTIKRRFPVPSGEMSWFLWLFLFALYCGAPFLAASTAQDDNRKKKPDQAEVVTDVALEGIDIVHEIFKHHH